jgi:hypothetical protein
MLHRLREGAERGTNVLLLVRLGAMLRGERDVLADDPPCVHVAIGFDRWWRRRLLAILRVTENESQDRAENDSGQRRHQISLHVSS